jgi:hypothetical protein
MSERLGYLLEEHDKVAFHKAMDGIASLPEFRAFLSTALPTVPVEELLHDFVAQTKLQELFGIYDHKIRSDYYSKQTPVLILKKEGETDSGRKTLGGTALIEPRRFRLQDPDHIYYFNQVPQNDPMIIHIDGQRREHWAINRVAVHGGPAERYDYGSQQWLSNKQGSFRGVGLGNTRIGEARLPRVTSN